MTPSQHSPEELGAMEASAREMINERLALKRRERELLNLVVTWSLARGREWAVFASIDDIAILTGLLRPHCSTALIDLEERGLLHRISRRGNISFRFLPSGADLVEPAQRVDPMQIAALAAKMAALNEVPAGYEIGGQKLLPLQTAEERLADQMATMSRERADEMTADPYQIGTDVRTDSVREPYRIGTNESADTAARTRERAQHVHVPTSVPQSMVHDHEHARSGATGNCALRALNTNQLESKLDQEGRYWAEQLPAIFGSVGAKKFRRTWLLRFCDVWNGCAYRAIGEVKRMIVNGESFTVGPGECANDLFNRYKMDREQPEAKQL